MSEAADQASRILTKMMSSPPASASAFWSSPPLYHDHLDHESEHAPSLMRRSSFATGGIVSSPPPNISQAHHPISIRGFDTGSSSAKSTLVPKPTLLLRKNHTADLMHASPLTLPSPRRFQTYYPVKSFEGDENSSTPAAARPSLPNAFQRDVVDEGREMDGGPTWPCVICLDRHPQQPKVILPICQHCACLPGLRGYLMAHRRISQGLAIPCPKTACNGPGLYQVDLLLP